MAKGKAVNPHTGTQKGKGGKVNKKGKNLGKVRNGFAGSPA